MYTPTEWNTGDTITAEKLNKLENGVRDAGGGALFTLQTIFTNDGQTIVGHLLNGVPYATIKAKLDNNEKIEGFNIGRWLNAENTDYSNQWDRQNVVSVGEATINAPQGDEPDEVGVTFTFMDGTGFAISEHYLDINQGAAGIDYTYDEQTGEYYFEGRYTPSNS